MVWSGHPGAQVGQKPQLSHGKPDGKDHPNRQVFVTALTTPFPLEQTFPLWVSQGMDWVAGAFLRPDILVYPGAGPQPTTPLGGARICPLAAKECLASLGFCQLHFLA